MGGACNQRKYRNNLSNPLPGFYRARVEYNKDPLRLARVKVRIPQCHGIPTDSNSTFIQSIDLPWAYPCLNLGAGYDHGSFILPEVGDYVWVSFESGDPNCPVYFGACFGTRPEYDKPLGTVDDRIKSDKTFVASKGKWTAPAGCEETIQDAYANKDDTEPSVKVIYKSPKGATIKIDETDEKECLTFLDRLGQVFKFISPVTKEMNSDNRSARRTKTVENGTNLSHKVSFKDKTVILLKDLSDQLIRLVSTSKESKLELISRNESTKRVAGLVLKCDESDSSFELMSDDDSDTQLSVKGSSTGKLTLTVSKGESLTEVQLTGDSVTISSDNLSLISPNIRMSSQPTIEKLPNESVSPEKWVDAQDEDYIVDKVPEVLPDDLPPWS